MMSLGFSFAHVLLCGVCRQPRDEDKARLDCVAAVLFGTAPYAICCSCHQRVDDETMHDRNYRSRWRRYVRRRVTTQERRT